LKVSFEEAVDEAAWSRLVQADPAATPFHDPAWIRAWCRAYPGFRPGWLLARSPEGTAAGGLPVVRSTRAGLTQLLSLPYGAYGGPVAAANAEPDRAAVREVLLRAWAAEARKPGVVRAHLALYGWAASTGDAGPAVPAEIPAAWRGVERTRVLDLNPDFERVWTEAFEGRVRTAWRQAEKLGVEVAREEGGAAAREAERLYRSQAEAWSRHTPVPPSLFLHLAEADPELVEFWTARHAGRVVSVQIVVHRGGRAVLWASLNTPEARELRAGVLATGTCIRAACLRGDRTFDFGSSRDMPSIDAFKASFGGTERSYPTLLHEAGWFRPLHRLYYRIRGVG